MREGVAKYTREPSPGVASPKNWAHPQPGRRIANTHRIKKIAQRFFPAKEKPHRLRPLDFWDQVRCGSPRLGWDRASGCLENIYEIDFWSGPRPICSLTRNARQLPQPQPPVRSRFRNETVSTKKPLCCNPQ